MIEAANAPPMPAEPEENPGLAPSMPEVAGSTAGPEESSESFEEGVPGEGDPKGLLQRLLNWPQRTQEQLEGRWLEVNTEVEKLRGPFERTRLLVKVILLHVRYIFGYLTAGFLISAPLYFGSRETWLDPRVVKCLALGSICLVPFLLLLPLTRIEWERMRVPEFKLFELALTRWAAYVAGVYFLLSVQVDFAMRIGSVPAGLDFFFDSSIAWFTFVLMISAWLKIKAQVILFPDFYRLRPGQEDLVLHVPDIRAQGEASPEEVESPESVAEEPASTLESPTAGALVLEQGLLHGQATSEAVEAPRGVEDPVAGENNR